MTALKRVIAPHLSESKSEKIRNGFEDAEVQRQQQVKLRRLLEAKVEKLEKQVAEGGTGERQRVAKN